MEKMKKLGLLGLVAAGMLFVGCSNNQNTLPSNNGGNSAASSAASESTASSTQVSTQASDSSTTNSSTAGTSVNSEIKITAGEALKAYEEAYPNTSVTSLDLDTSFGTYYYDVKGVDDSVEYEIKVNAKTGEVTKEREEQLDREDQNGVERTNEALDIEGILSIDEAAAIAVKAAGNGEAIEWSLERELSTTYWEVKVKNGFSETSVKLDAKTGSILETELDD